MNVNPHPLPERNATVNQHSMVTRGKAGIFKPKVLIAEYIEVEPPNVKEALKCVHWIRAMNEEYNALRANDTWSLVDAPPNKKVIGCKWVFKIKRNSDGSIARYKARLVAHGFHQQADIDYTETFSPVVKPTTIRVLFTLALAYGWQLRQVDINNAFLHGVLTEEVFMTQPPGISSCNPHQVCKLRKALYGLKQAPRAWFERLSTFLCSFGFVHANADSSLLVYHHDKCFCYVLIYVDDIVITGSSSTFVEQLIQSLNKCFSLKDLGILSYFLGVEVSTLPSGGMFLSQKKYVSDLLYKTNMLQANPISTPMMSGSILSAFHGEKFADLKLYRSTIGALQYVTITRPEIAYSVNKVCQFMHSPTVSH